MADQNPWPCQSCGSVVFDDYDDGFRYCRMCGVKADDFIETGVAEEDFIATAGDAAIYTTANSRHRRHDPSIADEDNPEPISQSQFWSALTLDSDPQTPPAIDDLVGPIGPEDFGWIGREVPRFEDYHGEVRIRYVMGLQLMVEFLCEALVKEFKVSPLVCGLAGTVWMRLVAKSRVFDDGWVDDAINESESQQQGELPEDFRPRHKYVQEPHNVYGQRAVMIWIRSLKRKIPLSYTLAVSFLACHLAREAVLATDIEKWSVEGKLPYGNAFVEVEKHIGKPTKACPISVSSMFRPNQSVTAQKLESLAASIAESIGLALPPVNFCAIASRYLRKLCLPLDEILPHALRIYEWSMPPELWLSSNEARLPTRVGVMSILIVAIRIRYNIHGFGAWERSLSSCGTSPEPKGSEEFEVKDELDMKYYVKNDFSHDPDSTPRSKRPKLDTAKLLHNLEAYNRAAENYEYCKDLPTYLQNLTDKIFAGLEPSYDYNEERKLIDDLRNIHQRDLDSTCSTDAKRKRVRTDEGCLSLTPKEENKARINDPFSIYSSQTAGNHGDKNSEQSYDSSQDDEKLEHNDQGSTEDLNNETTKVLKDEAIRKLKLDMEENRFCYIPPRVKLKRFDYLHYARKRDEGALTFVAHADYYILLRACSNVAKIEIRLMHMGVLSFERRLAWIENRINQCVHLKFPSFSCENCSIGNASV